LNRPRLLRPALLLLAALVAQGGAVAREGRPPTQLPAEALDVVTSARGIQFNGSPKDVPALHLVCDAHCPYCAKLHAQLATDFPERAVRWVPIAYFRADSAALAARILSSSDPVAALDGNYRTYDFAARRGGNQAMDGRAAMLDYEHGVLREHWREWGGYTPMVLASDAQGRMYRARDTKSSSIRILLDAVAGDGSR